MKYVSSMGAVWKMTDKKFKELQDEIDTTGCVENLDNYGKMIVDRFYSLAELQRGVGKN